MSTSTLLPAIRSAVGDWIFYVTTLSFSEVAKLIKDPDEIHERKGLSTWIQRVAIEKHSAEISEYIKESNQRFLGSLIIGVYGGSPDWAPLNVKFTEAHDNVPEEQKVSIEGKLGLLNLTGSESLFPIDGQHRVAGIKKAIEETDLLDNFDYDHVSAIFVSHDPLSEEGKQRTRRLFTTVNKKAKRVDLAARIALDEDSGFAIVVRNLIDNHWLFDDRKKYISYSSGGAIPARDKKSISSVVGLYKIVQDLYPKKEQSKFDNERPSDEEIQNHLNFCSRFFDLLLENVPPFKSVFVDESETASDYREGNKNHLLFRPMGQRGFAKAVEVLISRGRTLDEAVTLLATVNMNLASEDWHYIVWNPIESKMLTAKESITETYLLRLVGEDARDNKHRVTLNELLQSIQENVPS
ncbi:DGQHR domain-containing protein [Methylobacillus gramineus]|uniref:DNA sulfur modification protein DndB n=1 Tax=Methylobacillus gramineus TaxID=755169 RepID=UPI001CFF7FE5|nr:DNA sulfur modification protein DndB [Methylobacillus gramineus]MCB5186142.1 DGQHR domain-containing protein [Methylobacillus gramineus]